MVGVEGGLGINDLTFVSLSYFPKQGWTPQLPSDTGSSEGDNLGVVLTMVTDMQQVLCGVGYS